MKDTIRLFVAVDGSEQSRDAIRYVCGLFPRHRTHIALFSVEPEVPESILDFGNHLTPHMDTFPVGAWKAEQAELLEKFMKKSAKAIRVAGFASDAASYRIEKRRAGVARDIIEASLRGYDAMVIGRRGVGAAAGAALGSVAAKLVQKIYHMPLIIVGGQPETHRILIAFDGSSTAAKAVDTVARFLSDTETEVSVCQVVRSLNIGQTTGEALFKPEDEARWIESVRQTLKPALDKGRQRLIDGGFSPKRIETEILTGQYSRAANLVSRAREGAFGTLVMGRRGLTIVEEFVSGRVTRKVLDMASRQAIWIIN